MEEFYKTKQFKTGIFPLFIFLLLMVNTNLVMAQNAVLTSGMDVIKNNYSLSYSIGEISVKTLNNQGTTLTQGQQQSNLTVTAINFISNPAISLRAYPNPTENFVLLEIQKGEPSDMEYTLSTITGKLLYRAKLTSSLETVEMNQFNSGMYLLRVINKRGTLIQTFKIIKR